MCVVRMRDVVSFVQLNRAQSASLDLSSWNDYISLLCALFISSSTVDYNWTLHLDGNYKPHYYVVVCVGSEPVLRGPGYIHLYVQLRWFSLMRRTGRFYISLLLWSRLSLDPVQVVAIHPLSTTA